MSPLSKSVCATLLTNATNFSFFAAKSVSILTSTRAIRVPSSEDFTPSKPLAAVRPAFFAAFKELFLRRSSIAWSISPPASARAFLQSIMPRPVRSRSSLTIAAEIAMRYSFPPAAPLSASDASACGCAGAAFFIPSGDASAVA